MTSGSALADVRVLEVTHFEVGTVCGMQLAWLGADVIKIEQPGRGDASRVMDGFFATLNSSKRSVALDLQTEAGRRVFLDMVSHVDVVIENQAPGMFERLGLGYEVLAERNPGIILARGKGFGTYGAYAGFRAFDMIAQATSGAMSVTGPPDEPTIERFPVADHATGLHLAIAVLGALWQRRTTGRGQVVEASLHDSMLSMGRAIYAGHLEGRKHGRIGPASGLFPCGPGGPADHVFIHCHPGITDMWEGLEETIGLDPNLRPGPDCEDPHLWRLERAEEIDAAIAAWTSQRSKHEAMKVLGAAGVPIGAVLTMAEVEADPHVQDREMILELDHPTRGPVRVLGSPVKLTHSPPRITTPPMDLGEHTHEVLRDMLGFGAEELAALAANGVINPPGR
jgi:formyl-CoA transferase